MITIRSLEKSFGEFKVLKNVTLAIQPGKITGLVGPNGCGKTTLIKSLLGLVRPDAGEILIDNEPVLGTHQYRKNLGYMPQNPDFPANLNVVELLDLIEDVRGEKAADRKALFEMFDLAEHAKQQFGVLSGGTKQRLSAVIALMYRPKILILDEPTVGLDPISSMKFKACVLDASARGQTVVMVSHIMSEVEQLVGRVVFLLDGQIQFQGEIRDLLAKQSNLELAIVELMKGQGGSRAQDAQV